MKKKTVYISTNILNISKINTTEETINANIEIISKWKIPEKEKILGKDNISRPLYNYDETNYKEIKHIVWKKDIWNPKLYIQNQIKCFEKNVSHKIIRENNELFIQEKQQIQGKFMEKMELMSFPFDKQHFEFIIQSKIEKDKIDLNFINWEGNIFKNSITEWTLYPYLQHKYSNQGNFSNIVLFFEGARIYKYYIWNILFINSLIQCIALSSICIDNNKPEERLNIGVVLLLTNIAFKLSNNMDLPNTSYLTYIDKYQLIAFLFHTLIVIQNVVSSFVTHIQYFDFWSYMFLIGIYIINHIAFTIKGYTLIKNN